MARGPRGRPLGALVMKLPETRAAGVTGVASGAAVYGTGQRERKQALFFSAPGALKLKRFAFIRVPLSVSRFPPHVLALIIKSKSNCEIKLSFTTRKFNVRRYVFIIV